MNIPGEGTFSTSLRDVDEGLKVVKDGRLDRRKRSDKAGSRREDRGRPYLVGALDQPDGQLRAEGHHPATVRLTVDQAKIERFEIVAEIIHVSLATLAVHVEVARTGQTEERGRSAAESPDAGNGLRPGRIVEGDDGCKQQGLPEPAGCVS